MGIRFFALPSHRMVAPPKTLSNDELVEPRLPSLQGVVDRALWGAEFRDMRARDRLRVLLTGDQVQHVGPPGPEFGPSVVFAQPPQDLPALLRMADQLDALANQDEGERALVWQCAGCQTRYAVPLGLVRTVSIKCERCGIPVELHADKALGEEALVDPTRGAVNDARRELAGFFREAMARGWPVLVAAQSRS